MLEKRDFIALIDACTALNQFNQDIDKIFNGASIGDGPYQDACKVFDVLWHLSRYSQEESIDRFCEIVEDPDMTSEEKYKMLKP